MHKRMTQSIMMTIGVRKEVEKMRWSGMGLVETTNPFRKGSEVHTEVCVKMGSR